MTTLGSRSVARNGRVLSPAFLERRWKPGQSGNPAGHTAEYGDVIKLAQDFSLRAMERLGELMESEDERVAAVACNSILDRAFGKPEPRRAEADDRMARLAQMTDEKRLAEAEDLVARAREALRLEQRRGTIEDEAPEAGE
jgi:hypothetical protein